MAKRHYGKSGRLHVTLPCEVMTLLDYAARVMGASSSEIARVALINWLSKSERKEPKLTGRDLNKSTDKLVVYLWPQVEILVSQLSGKLKATPSQIVRAAVIDWFQNSGGDLVYQVDSSIRLLKPDLIETKPVEQPKRQRPAAKTAKPKTAKPKSAKAIKPKPAKAIKPKPAQAKESEESLESILRQQIHFYQRQGNALKVGQLSRKLRQLEAAA